MAAATWMGVWTAARVASSSSPRAPRPLGPAAQATCRRHPPTAWTDTAARPALEWAGPAALAACPRRHRTWAAPAWAVPAACPRRHLTASTAARLHRLGSSAARHLQAWVMVGGAACRPRPHPASGAARRRRRAWAALAACHLRPLA